MSSGHDNELSERERELIRIGQRAELLEAVREVISEEMRTTLPEIVRPVVRDQVKDTLARYYGDRDPEQVLEVIRSAEKFHKRINDLASLFWKSAIATVVKWCFWVVVLVFFLTHASESSWVKSAAHHLFPSPLEE